MVKPVKMWGALFVVLAILFIIVTILVPFIFIWALNQLFSLNIQYSFWNWLAALIIMLILGWHKVAGGGWMMRPRKGSGTMM